MLEVCALLMLDFKQNLKSDISVKSLFQSRTSTLCRLVEDRQYRANDNVVTESANKEIINMAKGGLEQRKDDKDVYDKIILIEIKRWLNILLIKILDHGRNDSIANTFICNVN